MTDQPRLLLDEMFTPAIAEDLSRRGIDADTVCGHEVLGGLPDERVLDAATSEGRCLVTENVRDFERLRAAWTDQGKPVAALLYLSARRFPRTPATTKRITDAIAKAVDEGQVPQPGGVDWLLAVGDAPNSD